MHAMISGGRRTRPVPVAAICVCLISTRFSPSQTWDREGVEISRTAACDWRPADAPADNRRSDNGSPLLGGDGLFDPNGFWHTIGRLADAGQASVVAPGTGDTNLLGDLVNDGLFRTSSGRASFFLGAVSGTGSFTGTGTVFFEGDLCPGASPAQITFDGDVVFGSFSSLEIEIGGTTPGAEHDQLIIGQAAFLGGTLNVVLINGFVPQPGDWFEVLIGATVTGTFSSVSLPAAPPLQWVITYGSTFVRLAVAIRPDLDVDGDVDADDLALLGSCASGPAIPHDGAPLCQQADLDDDSDVDQDDFGALQRCWSGSGNPPDPGCLN